LQRTREEESERDRGRAVEKEREDQIGEIVAIVEVAARERSERIRVVKIFIRRCLPSVL
jgi:DNA-binding TFAR19-related protein (PDSD5 family)